MKRGVGATRRLLLACALGWVSASSARADELGAYGPACKALDLEYQEHIVLMSQVSETLQKVGSDKAQQGKLKSKVDKAVARLLKWARAQEKRFTTSFRGEELTKKLAQQRDSMERASSGSLKGGQWSQAVFGFSAASWRPIREAALAATLCFYDLEQPRELFKWDGGRESGGL